MAEIECRHFNGYKPCAKNPVCDAFCPSLARVGERILLVHLEALGAVLRSTSLLAAIKRRYPRSHITWVTKAPAHHLLNGIAAIDRVLTLSGEDLLRLSTLEFDLGFIIDKSLLATGVLKASQVHEVRGFVANSRHGAVLPANREALELWEIGLSDQKKFFENKKSEQRLVHESLALGEYQADPYGVVLNPEEWQLARTRRNLWSQGSAAILGISSGQGSAAILGINSGQGSAAILGINSGQGSAAILGINVGCSHVLPHKKLSVEGQRSLILKLRRHPTFAESPIVLLGGPEDREWIAAIARDLPVHTSPTERGLRDGLASVAACDLVFTGDSLGMHMAIGLGKWVVAWFGPTCAEEIELYGRGRKIRTEAPCSPCWKRDCQQTRMCYDQVDFNACIGALEEGLQWLTLSSKPLSPEISFSPSPY